MTLITRTLDVAPDLAGLIPLRFRARRYDYNPPIRDGATVWARGRYWSLDPQAWREWPLVIGEDIPGGMYSYSQGRHIPFHKEGVWYQLALPSWYDLSPIQVTSKRALDVQT